MKLKFKKSAFAPLLIVLFLLITSAVASYIVINQGTGGYKTRATGSGNTSAKRIAYKGYDGQQYRCMRIDCDKWIQSDTQLDNSEGTICRSARDNGGRSVCYWAQSSNPFGEDQCNVSSYYRSSSNIVGQRNLGLTEHRENVAYYNCENTNQATTNPPAIPPAAPAPTVCGGSGQPCCSVRGEGTTQYYCNSSFGCSAQTTLGVCQRAVTCPGGTLCRNNQPIVGAVNQIICGLNNVSYKCSTTGDWVFGPAGSCSSTTLGYCSTSGGGTTNPPAAPPAGTLSCEGGIYCGGIDRFTGEAGKVYCGQADAGGICRNHRCNGSTGQFEYIGDVCTYTSPEAPPPANDPPPPPANEPPPATTGNVTLALTLKLQGVKGNPRGGKTVPFKVKLKNAKRTTDYVTGTLTADSSGKWTGSVSFSGIALGADTGYSVYVKVGKHLQKRVCVKSPNESPVGTYSCSDNTIPLVAGANPLDFSGILQLVGDLKSESGEQNGVVDSYDISYVLNNLGSTEQSKLAIGDLNFDGVIDTQDRSLIIQSLNVKYDDE